MTIQNAGFIGNVQFVGHASSLSALPPPEWVPEGATHFLDFKNDQYYSAGSVVALEDVVGETSNGGYNFNASHVVGVGLVGEGNAGILGAVLADIIAGSAVVADMVFSGEPTAGWRISFDLFADPEPPSFDVTRSHQVVLSNETSSDNTALKDGWTGDETPLTGFADEQTGSIRVAFHFKADHWAASIAGGAVADRDVPVFGDPITDFAVALRELIVIESLAVYSAVEDADLPALSVLD